MRRRKIPPSKQRYIKRNPIISICITEQSGLKQFLDSYMRTHDLSSRGQAVKELLLLSMSSYLPQEAGSGHHISFFLDPKFKDFFVWYMESAEIKDKNYNAAVKRLIQTSYEFFERHVGNRGAPSIL